MPVQIEKDYTQLHHSSLKNALLQLGPKCDGLMYTVPLYFFNLRMGPFLKYATLLGGGWRGARGLRHGHQMIQGRMEGADQSVT